MRHTPLAPIANGNGQHGSDDRPSNGSGPCTAGGPYQAHGSPHVNGEQHSKSGFNALLEEAQALQNMLRDALGRINQLLAGLKQYRRQAKTMASTLTALRQLDSVEA